LFVKDLAVAHGGFQLAPLVVYCISIRSRSGSTFRHFAFFCA
jgi:hypothetical protein